MRRTGLCLLAIVMFCSGQVCSPLGAGDPGPEDLGLPIPEGTYSGEIPARARATLNSLTVATTTEPMPVTQAFGSDGQPLTDANEPMGAGYKVEEQSPEGTTTITVKSIESDDRSLTITYDATMSISSAGRQVVMTGTATRTYTPKADGSLAIHVTMDVSGQVNNGVAMGMVVDGNGYLTRQ